MKLMYDGEAVLANGGSSQPVMGLITLRPSGWDSTKRQEIAVQWILEDESKQLIIPAPAIASQEAYNQANIRVVAQGTDSLIFQAETVPTAPIYVYISIIDVRMPERDLSEYMWWSPHMTANNAPAPYVASADSEYKGIFLAYYAFNKTVDESSANEPKNCWYSSNPNAWVQLDFGSAVSVAGIRIMPSMYSTRPAYCMKGLAISGSGDGTNWEMIIEDAGNEYNPYIGEWRVIMFNNPVQFRYFRVTANGPSYGGYDQSMIDEIEFFKKEEGTSDGGL